MVKDFNLISMYSNGTAIHLEMGVFASIDHIMNILSFFCYGVNRLIHLYCPETIDYELSMHIDELEKIIEKYVN